MSEHERDDEELKEFLQRRSDVSRAYRNAADELPQRSLDAAILDAANRAVAPRRKPWAMRWGPPLAAAAVVALAVAVTLQLRDQADLSIDAPTPRAAAPFERRQAETEREPQRQPQRQARGESKRDNGAQPDVSSSGQAKRPERELAPQGNIAAAPPREARESRLEQESQPALQADREDAVAGERKSASQSGPSSLAKSRKEQAQPAAPAPLTAENALTQIRQQYGRGEMEQADRALRQFCLDFPRYSMPRDLAARAARLTPACRNVSAE